MAPADDAAAAVLDWPGGPAHPPTSKRSFLRKATPTEEAYEVLPLTGVEPTVTMGQLDALLTHRSIDEVIHDPARKVIAMASGGERFVVPLGGRFEEALLELREDQLQEVAREWSQVEEFSGQGDATVLADGIRSLATLVRTGLEHDHHLYCWVSV